MRAARRFKSLLRRNHPRKILARRSRGNGQGFPYRSSKSASSSVEYDIDAVNCRSHSVEADNRIPIESALASEGVLHAGTSNSDAQRRLLETIPGSPDPAYPEQQPTPEMGTIFQSPPSEELPLFPTIHTRANMHQYQSMNIVADADQSPSQPGTPSTPTGVSQPSGTKGHARDPLEEPPMYLGIGRTSLQVSVDRTIAESPSPADFEIYDTAFKDEVRRIRQEEGDQARVYLTRRVDKAYTDLSGVKSSLKSHFKGSGSRFSDLARIAAERTRGGN